MLVVLGVDPLAGEVGEGLGGLREPGVVEGGARLEAPREQLRDLAGEGEVEDRALLEAVFPGGSITGAPKLRAMEIIDALEAAPRGIYTGAIGYLAPDGAISTSIAIRTAQIVGGEVRFGVGGGIVADSAPSAEWAETQVKARALSAALQG